MPNSQHIADLIFKSFRKELTEQEELELAAWRTESEQNEALIQQVSDPEKFDAMLQEYFEGQDKAWEKVTARIPELAERKVRKLPVWKIVVAAATVLVIGSIVYFNAFKPTFTSPPGGQVVGVQDIPAGTNKAILTLANGSIIHLGNSSRQAGSIAADNHIKSLDSNLISYTPSTGQGSEILYNILETPRGGQFQLSLPDGTSVWLNAASSIKYPVAFSGTTRQVEITGEVYLEVAKNSAKPFIATVRGADIKVLGTHFNVSAYSDENDVTTTLLEGSIQISKENNVQIIKPGQQARIERGSSKIQIIQEVNTDQVVAWKNGRTLFSDASIPEIMRMISRWYDVDIEYSGKIPERKLSGGIPRTATLMDLFKVLEAYNIHLKKEGRKITIMQ